MTRRFLAALAVSVSLLMPPRAALGDECASYGPEAFLAQPYRGSTVARNVRFEINLNPTCGGIEGGPPHQFRLLESSGRVLETTQRQSPSHPNCRPVPCLLVTLTPRELLPIGQKISLQQRRPVSATALSGWEQIGVFTVADRVDDTPPEFDGIESTTVSVVEGTVPISPCQAVKGWELEIRFRFRLARDGQTDQNELVYTLERQSPGATSWERLTEFRPQQDDSTGWGQFAWRDRSGWGHTYNFRILVADASGHSTIGSKTTIASSPSQPEAPPASSTTTAIDPAPATPAASPAPVGLAPKRAGCRACSIGMHQAPPSGLGLGLLATGFFALRRVRRRPD